jgi:hypothetical protein
MVNTDKIHVIYGAEKGQTLALSAYNGTASFTTFMKDGNRNRPVKFPLTPSLIDRMKQELKKLLTGAPGTRISFVRNTYDSTNKKYEKDVVLILGKDEKQIIYFDIQDKKMSQPARFYLQTPKAIQIGSDIMTDTDRSIMETSGFINVVLGTILPTAIIASRDAARMKEASDKFMNGGGNKGGGSNYTKSEPSFSSSDSSGDDEDSIFDK